MDIYLSSINNRMNEIMKQLTVVATIFMPLTLISGIYGMNIVRGMWPPIEAAWSFAAVVGGMLAHRRRRWRRTSGGRTGGRRDPTAERPARGRAGAAGGPQPRHLHRGEHRSPSFASSSCPIFFSVFLTDRSDTLAFVLFVAAASTDWLDGQIARRTGTVTAIGKAIDPLVDRLLIASGVIGLYIEGRLPLWIVLVLWSLATPICSTARGALSTITSGCPSTVHRKGDHGGAAGRLLAPHPGLADGAGPRHRDLAGRREAPSGIRDRPRCRWVSGSSTRD